MVSLKTIAEKCGVSTATVSKAERYQRRDKEPCQKDSRSTWLFSKCGGESTKDKPFL